MGLGFSFWGVGVQKFGGVGFWVWGCGVLGLGV